MKTVTGSNHFTYLHLLIFPSKAPRKFTSIYSKSTTRQITSHPPIAIKRKKQIPELRTKHNSRFTVRWSACSRAAPRQSDKIQYLTTAERAAVISCTDRSRLKPLTKKPLRRLKIERTESRGQRRKRKRPNGVAGKRLSSSKNGRARVGRWLGSWIGTF